MRGRGFVDIREMAPNSNSSIFRRHLGLRRHLASKGAKWSQNCSKMPPPKGAKLKAKRLQKSSGKKNTHNSKIDNRFNKKLDFGRSKGHKLKEIWSKSVLASIDISFLCEEREMLMHLHFKQRNSKL